MRGILEDHYFWSLQAAAAAGDATRATMFFVAPFAIQITGVWIAPLTAVTGTATNFKNVQLYNPAGAGLVLASLPLSLGNNLAALAANAVPLTATETELEIASGVVLHARLEQVLTGIAVPVHVFGVSFKPA